MREQVDPSRSGNGSEPSAGRLMKEIAEDVSTLVRKEVELVKQEVGRSISEKVRGVLVIGIAGALGFFALIFMLLAIRDGLAEFLWTWVADLVTAGILLAIGVAAALIAKKKLTTPISAELTKQSLKEDVDWAKTVGRR